MYKKECLNSFKLPALQQRTLDGNDNAKRTPWQIFALRITLILLLLGGGSGFGGWTYLSSVRSQTDAFGLTYSGMVDRLAIGLPLALVDKKAAGTVIADLFAYTSTGFLDLPLFDQVRGTPRTNREGIFFAVWRTMPHPPA